MFDFSRFLGWIVRGYVYATVLLVPLWFLPNTVDVLELNKQTLLVIFTMIGLVAFLGKAMVDQRWDLRRSWLYLVVFFFTLGYFVTSFFSQDQYLSFVGNFGQMQWAFATIVACVLAYSIISFVVKTSAEVYHLLLAFLGSSTVVGIYGFLQLVHVVPFNTIGTAHSLSMYMAIPLVLSASLLVLGCKDDRCVLFRAGKSSMAAKILIWISLIVSVLSGVVVDFWGTWAAALFGMVLLVGLMYARGRVIERPAQIAVPILIGVLSIGLLIWHTPFSLDAAGEVSPTARHSLQIANSVLKDKPLFGSGPGTWIYDYSQYRNATVNLSQFWTVRFERSRTTFYTLLATVGIVGTSLWVLLILSGFVKSVSALRKKQDENEWQVFLTVFVAWSTSVFTAFIYNYNVSHHVVFWFLFALVTALVAKEHIAWEHPKPVASGILSSVFILVAVGAIAVTWLAGQRLVADMRYATAVHAFQAKRPVSESVDALTSAVGLNKLNDAYYRNLSQAYLVRLGQEMQNQQNGAKDTELNTLLTSTVDAAKRATEISPANVDNWSNLAVVYQSIAAFTPGADELAIAAFQEAVKREPNNPIFPNEMGKLHVLRADAYRTLRSSKDEKVRTEAEAKARAELDKAAEQLNKAIQLKGDYAPAHFNLGIVYERQGRLKDAITKIEQVLIANNKDIGVGFQLASLYYNDGQKEKAQDLFEQILALDPTYSNARWFLGYIYEEKSRFDDAIAQIEKVREQNPDSTVVKQRLEELKKARETKQPTAKPVNGPVPLSEQINGPKSLNEVTR